MVLAITTFPSTTFKHGHTTSTVACGHHYHYRHYSAIIISNVSKIRPLSFTVDRRSVVAGASPTSPNREISNAIDSGSRFTWDDVFRISQSQDVSLDLSGFFKKIELCNRGWERCSDFIPFVVEDQVVGYIHNNFLDHLSKFNDVFTFIKDNTYGSQYRHVTLQSALKTPERRTEALKNVVKRLGEKVIPGIRNEVLTLISVPKCLDFWILLYPVTSSYGGQVYFLLERAATPYFGIKAYGVIMNGYVERDGQKYLWVGKRSEVKPTYPGMLDHLVAGGLINYHVN
ncbi:hypothetical protein OSB04_021466 [Centaurea solstitialis]|uniref:DUF4743 domain-containing protein n=1 Tax=Centaurea solstitialis TaxID=347529 RepID=A0AA38SUJ5_9ASTR|nr:hypothetical protein OSB04_021466 [Centaurea solstitialis]